MPPLASARATSTSSWHTTLTNAPRRTSGRAARARSMPHRTRSGSAPRASVTRSASRAAASITLGPLAATVTGTFGRSRRQPVETAARGAVRPGPRVPTSATVSTASSAKLDRVAAQVGLHLGEVALEHGDGSRRQAEVGEGGVAAADAQHGAPAGRGVDAGDGRRGHGRVAGVGVGDARCRAGSARSPPRPARGRRSSRRPGSGCRRRTSRRSRRPRPAAPSAPPPLAGRSRWPTPRSRPEGSPEPTRADQSVGRIPEGGLGYSEPGGTATTRGEPCVQ